MNKENPWWATLPLPTLESKPVKVGSYKRGIYAVVAAFLAIIVGMVTFLILGPDPEKPHPSSFNSIAYPANTESLIAQCGETFTFNPQREHYGALPDDFFKDPNGGPGTIERRIPLHPMAIPSYGYFVNDDRIKFDKVFYTSAEKDDIPQGNQYLKMMWDGWIIIWYNTDVDKQTTDAIKDFVQKQDKVVAMPWVSSVKIPLERRFAFSAWNTTRSCGLWDSDVARQFVSFANERNELRDKNDIPTVKLDDKGEIPLIDLS